MAIQMKLRAIGHEMKGTMHNLIEKGRKCGIIPPIAPGTVSAQDPFAALVKIRNAIAHGTTDVHTPASAFDVLKEIGRASCRERVWQYVLVWVVAGSLKKKKQR